MVGFVQVDLVHVGEERLARDPPDPQRRVGVLAAGAGVLPEDEVERGGHRGAHGPGQGPPQKAAVR